MPSVNPMRKFAIAYSILAICAFGWLTGSFGLLPSLFASIIVFSPAAFAWRMVATDRTVKRREFVYLGIVTMLAVTASVFIVSKWYETGMDRLAVLDREIRAFQKHVATIPEYKNVEVTYTHRKGGRVYLHGTVTTKTSYERLLQTLNRMVRNNESGYYDGVEYPGKTGEQQAPNGA